MTQERTDEEQVWHEWLDGDTINRIARYSHLSVGSVKAIIEAGIPETMREDPRHVYGCRALWVAADNIPAMVFFPRRINSTLFVKALRAIRRLHRATGEGMNITMLEGIEMDVAFRMVQIRGSKAYRFDVDGNASEGLPMPVGADDIPPPTP